MRSHSQPTLFEPTRKKPGLAQERTAPEVIEAVKGQEQNVGPYHLGSVVQADCIEAMRHLPAECFDLVIADPPYNASKGGEWHWNPAADLPGFGGAWAKVKQTWDNCSVDDYFGFTVAWLREVQRVVRPTGSIWIHGTYHNIGIVNFVLQLLGMEIINEVAWFKRNSFPNLSGRRLTASHETILWAHTGKKRKYRFNYQLSKELPCIGDGLKNPGKQMRTVWDIPNNKERDELRFGKHPTQKPLRLARRMIALSSAPNQTLLAPFSGAGSECVAAKQLGLQYLAFELDPEFVSLGNNRLAATNLGSELSMWDLALPESDEARSQ